MPRIPNWKINQQVQDLNEFSNYNGTITATRSGGEYVVIHWNTTILRFDIETKEVKFLYEKYFSQTTSTLIGRLVRSLPRESVMRYIQEITDSADRQRFRRMLGRIDPEIW